MKKNSDRNPTHEVFQKSFVKIVDGYLANPTKDKHDVLVNIIADAGTRHPELQGWFNSMYRFNIADGVLEIAYRHEPQNPTS